MDAIKEKLKNFFSTMLHDDRGSEWRDSDNIGLSSSLLQISEFEFFRLAYFQWYGKQIGEGQLEYVFDDYMFEEIVPSYVRHFTRRILGLFEGGTLDPSEFGISPPRSTPEMRSAGIGYTVILTIVVIVFCALISGYTPYD